MSLIESYARPLSEHAEDELLLLVRTSPARGLAAYDELRDRGWSRTLIESYVRAPLSVLTTGWIR